MPSKNKTWLEVFYPITFLIIGIFAYLLNTSNFFTSIPGDLGDARFNSVVLEHIAQWVSGDVKSLWSPEFFYPFNWTLAFSDNHFGSAWAYVPLRLLGASREIAYLTWFCIGTILNFILAYYSFRKINFSNLASSIGAYIFAFSLPALALEMHAQLVFRFAAPLAFVSLWNFLTKGSKNDLWKCFFWLSVQFFCSIYIGVFLIYFLAAVFIATMYKKDRWPELLRKLRLMQLRKLPFLLGVIGIIATIWLLSIYGFIANYYGFHRSTDETLSMLPHFSSYFLADRSRLTSWVGAWVSDIQPHLIHEQQMFFGLGVWLFVLVGILGMGHQSDQKKMGGTAIVSFLILFFLSISFFNFSFYRLMLYLPGVSSVRVVSRISLIMLLPLSILCAIGVDYLRSRYAGVYIFIAAILTLSPEVMAYQPYSTPISQWDVRLKLSRKLINESFTTTSILFVSSKDNANFFLTELDGMMLAQEFKIPTLNGYSGNAPSGHLLPNPCSEVDKRINELGMSNKEFAQKLHNLRVIRVDLDGHCVN